MDRLFLLIAALLGFGSVTAGAFGSHVLKTRLSVDMMAIFEMAVRYQMYHALALLAVGLLAGRLPSTSLSLSGWLMVAGTLIFSGSLYVLALSGVRWLGAITPIGGSALLAGWLCLAWAVWTAAPGR